MNKVKVSRQSVCAADDQLNPLSLEILVAGSETLQQLMARILSRNFLQFSSSRSTMTGFAAGIPVVEVHADVHSEPRTAFIVAPDTLVETCLPEGLLEFEWTDSTRTVV